MPELVEPVPLWPAPLWPAPVDDEPLSFCVEPLVLCDPFVPVFVFPSVPRRLPCDPACVPVCVPDCVPVCEPVWLCAVNIAPPPAANVNASASPNFSFMYFTLLVEELCL